MNAYLPNRRNVMVLGLGGVALAACGDNSTSGTQTVLSPRNTSDLTIFRRGNGAEPKTLDPHVMQGTWEDNIIGDILMGLMTQDAQARPIAGAAERWETSEDGLSWTFYLRDHQWSDGNPVTADDFVFAWRRILDPKTAATYAYFLYPIKNAEAVNSGKAPGTSLGITARDPKTLTISLEHPVPYLLEFLMHGTTFPVPRHVVEAKGNAWSRPENYVSNGPFVPIEWIPNDRITLKKNSRFYDAANVKLETVVFYPTTDYQAGLQRFRAGELDIQDRYPVQQIDWIRANMPETIHPVPLLTTEYMAVNYQRKPFDDLRVREALSLALDRETLCEKIIKNGSVPAYAMVPPGMANYPHRAAFPYKSMKQPERLARAQELMKQAGYRPDNLLRTTFFIRSSSAEARRVPAAIQQMWKLAYFDVEIIQNDASIFYDKIQEHDFDIAQVGWSADFNDPINFLTLFTKDNSNNYMNYDNPEFDAFIRQSNAEQDLVKRGDILNQAEELAIRDHAWVPLYFWVSQIAVRPDIKGWIPNASDTNRSRFVSF